MTRVVARVASLGVLDADNDVLLRGCLPSPVEVPIGEYAHTSWTSAWPIGRGVVHEQGDALWLEGDLFASVAGEAARVALQGLRDLAEWSIGWLPIRWRAGTWLGQPARLVERLGLFEVAPVLVGASPGTGTVTLSSDPRMLELRRLELDNRAHLPRRDRREAQMYLADRRQARLVAAAAAERAAAIRRSGRQVDAVQAAAAVEHARFLGVRV